MMQHDEDTGGLVKRVTAATIKAVSGRSDVIVAYAAGDADLRGGRVKLPVAAVAGQPGRHLPHPRAGRQCSADPALP